MEEMIINEDTPMAKPTILRIVEKEIKPSRAGDQSRTKANIDKARKLLNYNPQTTLREGLKKSLNLISVRIVQELISPLDVKKTASRFGFRTPIRAVDAIALGVSDVYPIDITLAYSALSYNGILHEPMILNSIKDREGNMIKNYSPVSKEVSDERTTFIIRDMMKSVVDNGTGGSLRWKYKFYSPAAGKTGTTNNKTDAWFIGFTPYIAMGIWVGIDDPQMKLGEKQYGSNAAMPIFAKTITGIYKLGNYFSSGKKVEISKQEDWSIPEGIVEKNICKDIPQRINRLSIFFLLLDKRYANPKIANIPTTPINLFMIFL